METIVSKDNGRMKEYAKLSSSRKHRDELGLFTLESVKLLKEAMQEKIAIREVYLTERCLSAHPELHKLMEDQAVYLISEGVEGKLTQSKTPQGAYAVCKKLDKPENLAKIDCNGSYLGLWDLQDPGNVGAILRGADAMGLSGVILSESCCDLYNPKTVRAAMGSLFRVPCFITDMEAFLRSTPLKSYAAVVDSSAQPVQGLSFNGAIAVIGNEGNGLSKEQAACCSELLTIPMAGNAQSLNAAMAATILMWEMARQAR